MTYTEHYTYFDAEPYLTSPDLLGGALEVNDPENATRDQAIALLNDLKSGFHGMAHNNPELLAKLKQELDSNPGSNEQK